MFEELGTAIDQLDIPADGAALAAILALRDRFDARISHAVATHDHAGLWELDGATSMTAWLTDRARMPRARAAATTSRARKLAHLPVTAGAWRDGVLSSGQIDAITTNLDPDTLAVFADHETVMVPTLAELSVRDVATAMAAWRECATIDRDPRPEPAQALYLSPTLAGRWRLDANLGPETGELLATALRLAQTPDGDGEAARTVATRRGDALGDICRHFLDHQHTHGGGRHRPHLNLTLDIDRYRALRTAGARSVNGGRLDRTSTVHRVPKEPDHPAHRGEGALPRQECSGRPTDRGHLMTEGEAKKLAAERGWTVEKHDRSYRIVDSDGTLVAADWSTEDGFGLSLADVAKVLEP